MSVSVRRLHRSEGGGDNPLLPDGAERSCRLEPPPGGTPEEEQDDGGVQEYSYLYQECQAPQTDAESRDAVVEGPF